MIANYAGMQYAVITTSDYRTKVSVEFFVDPLEAAKRAHELVLKNQSNEVTLFQCLKKYSCTDWEP